MAIRFFFYFLLSLSFFHGEATECIIRYQSLSAGSIYHVETEFGRPLGKVIRQSNQHGVFYFYFGKDEELLARAEAQQVECKTIVHFFNCDGENLGFFEAEIYNLYPNGYHIYSPDNQLISKGYLNWLCNHLVLAHPTNAKHLFVTFSRPMFKLPNDHWHFQIHEAESIPFAILAVMGAFQTACDLKFEIPHPKKQHLL